MIKKIFNFLKAVVGNIRVMLASSKNGFWCIQTPCIVGIMYHGISRESGKAILPRRFRYTVPFDQFECQLRYFRQRYEIIGIKDLEKRDSWQRNQLIVTFDDGYRNFYTNAYPILKQSRTPALLFIWTGFVQNQKAAWNDRIFHAVKNTQKEELNFSSGSSDYRFSLLGEKQKFHAFQFLLRLFSDELNGPKREELIECIVNKLGVSAVEETMMNDENFRPLDARDIRKMAKEGLVSFGSHTVNHYNLGKCDERTIFNELFRSKKDIEEWTGMPCVALSLPGGSWKNEIKEIAKGLGYKFIFNSVPDVNRLPINSFNIKRYCIRENSILNKQILFNLRV